MYKILSKAAVVTIASVLVLTGCATAPEKSLEKKADGSSIVPAEGVIALYSTPEVANIPTWSVSSLPAGWVQTEEVVDTNAPDFDAEEYAKYLSFNPSLIYNEDKTCYVQALTFFEPSNNLGRGDLYLSKNSLYDEADSGWYKISNEKIVNIPTSNGGLLEMYSANIGYPPSMFGSDGVSADAEVWSAYRTIDKSFPNPFPVKREPQVPVLSEEQKAAGMTIVDNSNVGPDRTNVLPSYIVSIGCKTKEQLDKVDKQSLLDGLVLNF